MLAVKSRIFEFHRVINVITLTRDMPYIKMGASLISTHYYHAAFKKKIIEPFLFLIEIYLY
jgi:hypothetical protein